MAVLLHKWEFKNIAAEFLKKSENINFDHKDFQILEQGSPGASRFLTTSASTES